MDKWPQSRSWVAFNTSGNVSQDTCLPRLQVLDLRRYGWEAVWICDEHEHTGRLHFPELKVLGLECLSAMPGLLAHSVFPARIDRLFILATGSTLLKDSSIPLPSARCIHIAFRPDSGQRSDMRAGVKRMLDAARDCDEVELEIACKRLLRHPGVFASAPLTRLLVTEDVNPDIVVTLIRRLPRLSSLVVQQLMDSSASLDASIPRPGANRLVRPISSTLEAVQLKATCRAQTPATVISLAKYLLVAVPSLSYLSTMRSARQPIEGFVEEHAGQYPHLAKARFSYLLSP